MPSHVIEDACDCRMASSRPATQGPRSPSARRPSCTPGGATLITIWPATSSRTLTSSTSTPWPAWASLGLLPDEAAVSAPAPAPLQGTVQRLQLPLTKQEPDMGNQAAGLLLQQPQPLKPEPAECRLMPSPHALHVCLAEPLKLGTHRLPHARRYGKTERAHQPRLELALWHLPTCESSLGSTVHP